MMAEQSATTRDADRSDRTNAGPSRDSANHAGAMTLQSARSYEAAPQTFVRLTGSHLAKPRAAAGACDRYWVK